MPFFRFQFRRLWLPLLGLMVFGLGGCSDNDRLVHTAELDEPYYREGQALLKTGRKQEALSAFLKVIDKRGEDSAESHLSVGLLYAEHINDPLSAIYHFRKFLALRPNSPQAGLVRQRIDAATRNFARTLPAQPLENQMQRVDLVATLDRLKQENDRMKQELADLKSGRLSAAATPAPDYASTDNESDPIAFSFNSIPTVRTRPTPPASSRPAVVAPSVTAAQPKPTKPAPAAAPAASGGKKHVVQAGDTLSKLAQQYYKNRGKWRDILAANRGVMKNENDLKIGMELRIP